MVTVNLPDGNLTVEDRFSYTRQVGDIGNVSTSNSNHTNAFSIRRDKVSIRALKGLGLPASDSDVPYVRTPTKVKINGVDIVSDGWLNIMETTNNDFKISVLDGNIDFWKAIEGVTLQDIDLSESSHEKNLANVIASYNNPYYRYILADYGGQTDTETQTYNIAHLPPSINESYIFDRIFQYIGMTFNMSPVIDTWLTYPKESGQDLGMDIPNIFKVRDGYYPDGTGFNLSFKNIKYDLVHSQNGMVVNEDLGATGLIEGNYDVSYTGTATAEYELEQSLYGDIIYVRAPINIQILISGVVYNGPITALRILPSDTISINFISPNDPYDFGYGGYLINSISDLEVDNFEISLTKYIFEEINFGDALKSIKATEFVKWIMHRYGLTLFYDEGNVNFLTVDERLNAEVVDYSEYFKERFNEKYVYSNYAQRNLLSHKYVNDDVGFNDGVILNNNRNLREEITLLTSFTYSPTRDKRLVNFDVEVKENNAGEISVEYKWVNRNFSIKNTIINQTTTFYSDIEENTIVHVGEVAYLNLIGTTFKEYKNLYYTGIERILNNSKIQRVAMNMSFYVFLNIDLAKKIYLKSESAEYLINKVDLKTDEVEMELIKLNPL